MRCGRDLACPLHPPTTCFQANQPTTPQPSPSQLNQRYCQLPGLFHLLHHHQQHHHLVCQALDKMSSDGVSITFHPNLPPHKFHIGIQMGLFDWLRIDMNLLQPDSEATLVSPHDETSGDEMSEECDCKSCTRSSSTWSSSDGWPASRLPGCSKEDGHSKPWIMTTTTMQAYVAMKGGGTDAKDSLLRFTSKQDERRAQKGGSEG